MRGVVYVVCCGACGAGAWFVVARAGMLVNMVTAPRRKTVKIYEVGLEFPISGSPTCPVVKAFAKGVELGDGTRCKPARVELAAGPDSLPSRHVRVYLREGKYHQIRRMMAALGHYVSPPPTHTHAHGCAHTTQPLRRTHTARC